MFATSLEDAKRHLRVMGTDDDAIIQLYLSAAEIAASDFLNRAIYADASEQGADIDGVVINPAITAAVLLICGHLYANREDVVIGATVAELPSGSRMLLQPYRVGLGV